MIIKDTTEFIEPFGIEIDIEKGIMKNPKHVTVRKASDMKGYYSDEKALQRIIEEQDDPLHYEVLEVPVPEQYGHLMYCLSVLQPGLVGEECFMTKGHYHTIAHTAEIYLCLRGKGYMMMKTMDGLWKTGEMARGRMIYVPPYWAHRSINTGDEPLVSFCVYPGDAGHNYGDIATEGFPKRIFKRNSKIIIE